MSPLARRRRVVRFVAKSGDEGLALLAALVERGTITPVIDRLSRCARPLRGSGDSVQGTWPFGQSIPLESRLAQMRERAYRAELRRLIQQVPERHDVPAAND